MSAMPAEGKPGSFESFVLDYSPPTDPELQASLEEIDATLRRRFEISTNQTAAGVLDLKRLRLAMVRPDWMTYGASVPKIGILLAYFRLNPGAETHLDAQTRHELGLMIKASSNELAAKFSQALGLKPIQDTLSSMSFYDPQRGGGIWVGKHYGVTGERIGEPLHDFSHAVTVQQVLRFYLLLEQRKLVSGSASTAMRGIFESPDIPHERNKFLRGLNGRGLEIIRKSGSWENWLHDSAVITGPNRHYILVGLTEHPQGDRYLTELARMVDDLMNR